ncbi:MAG: DUF4175 family protein [candidate division Zixibacteria bacterium]|nr:DUF4175 family protein [candidate division Zixibacteria bacterium]
MPGLDHLLTRLTQMRRRAIAAEWLTHLGWMVALSSLAFVSLALIAAIIIPPSAVRVVLTSSIIACLALLVLWGLAKATIWSPRRERLALAVEKQYPELKNRLIASLQLADRALSNPEQYSLALVDLTIAQATQISQAIDFATALDRSRLRRSGRWAGLSAAAALLLAVLFPGLAQRSWEAYSRPLTDYSAPIPYRLIVGPGSVEAVKFDDFRITAKVEGAELPMQVLIYQRSDGGDWRTLGPVAATAPQEIVAGSTLGTREFRQTIPQIKRDFEYYVTAGRLKSATYQVTAVDRPRVSSLRLEIFPPSYTGIDPTVIDANDGTISAPVGTKVKMRLESNRDLASAIMDFSDGTTKPMEARSKTASLDFDVEKNASYHVTLTDLSARTNPHPIEYSITAIPDRDPSVDIVLPGHNSDLNDNMAVDLKFVARDDYGFSRLTLHTQWLSEGRLRAERAIEVPGSRQQGERLETGYFWDLKDWGLLPEDVVHYFVEVADNDAIGGPKTALSKTFTVRLPSLDEMMSEFEEKRDADLSALDKVMSGEREMARQVESLRRELSSKEEVDWQNQQKLSDVASRGQKLNDELDQLAQNMQEQVQKAETNKLASLEMLQKMQEAQQLFNEVATPEMREAQKRLQEALQKLDPHEVEQALAQMKISQDEMLKRLDRTIAYLKKLKAEQKVDAFVKRLEQMLAEQKSINDQSAKSPSTKLPDLAPSESGLKSEFEKFADEMAAAESLLTEAKLPPEQVSQFCQAAKKSPAPSQMEKTSQALQQQNTKGAQEGGQESAESLQTLLDQMKELQKQMSDEQKAEVAKELREALDKVFYLSDQQEDLASKTDQYDPTSLSLRDLAAQQEALKSAAQNVSQQLTELGKKSCCLANSANSMMGKAIDQMSGSAQCLSDRRGPMAGNSQKEALFGLNQAAQQIVDGMDKNSGQCNNPGSCNNPGDGAIPKMQNLSQKQGRLNSQMPGPEEQGSTMSDEERQLLHRLKGEQEAIKHGVDELNSQVGSKENTLGRLDKLAEEMQRVVEDMGKSEVSQQTLERQRKIYTRMLDFQNALQRQDYKDERKAQFGDDIRRASPQELGAAAGMTDEEYERLLTRYQEEGYPKEYEETIKAYFRALVESRSASETPQR